MALGKDTYQAESNIIKSLLLALKRVRMFLKPLPVSSKNPDRVILPE
jgi:hypothetical protein